MRFLGIFLDTVCYIVFCWQHDNAAAIFDDSAAAGQYFSSHGVQHKVNLPIANNVLKVALRVVDVRPFGAGQQQLERPAVVQALGEVAGAVGVGVDQAGDQHAFRTRDGLLRLEPGAGLGDGQHGEDDAVAHPDRVVFEQRTAGRDRDHMAGFDQEIAEFRDKGFGHGLIGHGGIVAFRGDR
ncbi:MAG: hypothetical protein HC937_03725 [Aquincola sp.]|nr:hypothetical protein [Aquincola sp.]